jgi:hypothetical protein
MNDHIICGFCNQEFNKREDHLNHKCEITGVTPRDPETMGTGFEYIQKLALERTSPESTTTDINPELIPDTIDPNEVEIEVVYETPPETPLVTPDSEENIVSAIKLLKLKKKLPESDE